jgi:hypothetical protein
MAFTVEKVTLNLDAFENFKKLPKVNNRPMAKIRQIWSP